MSDLRARLADVLGDAFINVPAGVNDDFSWANYLADVLLSLPGIAIVELPEPDSTRYEGDEHEHEDRLCWMPGDDFEISVWQRAEIQRCGYGWGDMEPISATEGRTIAAALLASADAAEQAVG